MANHGDEPGATHRLTSDRNTMKDGSGSRAQLGDQDHHNHHGPKDKSLAAVTPSIARKFEFDGMDRRRTAIEAAYSTTFQWFFDSREYRRWRDNSLLTTHNGILWIKGKPGAGKSTLMKLAVEEANLRFPSDLQISFFFNARGTALEKSLEGMYRSLLHQLLTQCAWLGEGLDERAFNQPTWPLKLLEECFRDCVLRLGSEKLTCHIDALDECKEADVRDMIAFFEDLGSTAVSSGVSIHVFFASRHYPHISISKCVHMVLDGCAEHYEDIRIYVQASLRISQTALRDEFVKVIMARASGVFLWVVIVVRLLNQQSDRGYNYSELRATLFAIPDGLHQLFEDAILESGRANKYLLPILLWILFARHPLTLKELCCAVFFTADDRLIDSEPNGQSRPSSFEGFILSASKGLTEIVTHPHDSKEKSVQFIHEVVQEFLQESGIGRLDKSLRNNLVGSSHDRLKTWCLGYVSLAGRTFRQSKKINGGRICCV